MMWNTWLEKGKELAASVDKKINEAVGVEVHGSAVGSSTASTSLTTSSSSADLPAYAADAPTEQKDLNDAWNDDFDDDDDENAKVTSIGSNHIQAAEETLADVSIDSEVHTESSKKFEVAPLAVEHLPIDDKDGDEEVIPVEDGWNENQDNELVEELDLDNNASGPLPSAIPIPALPDPINAISSILSSPAATQQKFSDDKPQTEPVSEPSPVLGTRELVAEQTPAEAAWEDELYANDDSDDRIKKGPPVVEHQEEILAHVPKPEITPPTPHLAPTSNGDKTHVPDSYRDEEVLQLKEEHQMAMAMLQSKFEEVQRQLQLREQQLTQKASQIFDLEAMHETERDELRKKINETKEEAKKRIQKAKERVASMEERLAAALKSANDDSGSQQELVAALRAEGELLARKQSEMEKAVRAAKGEARELRESLNAEVDAKEKALEKIANLESELKSTKESLSAARKGESQAGKLETELAQAKEDSNAKATTIMSLEQQIKELKAETKELRTEVESSKRGATIETEREMAKLRKEHNEVIADFELKLRTSEREAGVREDALRHEVAELRKRWQDAVRRADALSMDVQSSTAPLLRQLESMERQNRARASAWADLETKLRAELEDHVIQNENLIKERNELRTKHNRLERVSKERDEELTAARATIEELTIKTERLEKKLASMEEEGQKLKEEWAEVERLANEGVSRVRSEMTQTVVESETRYRSQIDLLEEELKTEKEKRGQLEHQVEELLANAGMIGSALSHSSVEFLRKESKPRKLRKAEGQADILAGALNGLGGDDDDQQDRNNPVDEDDDDDGEKAQGTSGGISSSIAAMEQLHQRLTGAKYELESLRMRLAESEKTREALVEELGESRLAKEKLPLFEAKIKELTEQNNEKELEIQGLRDDIAEVRELYRNQLNMLLEEKAASVSAEAQGLNGGSGDKDLAKDQPSETAVTPLQEDADQS